jgi:hypothetical protein
VNRRSLGREAAADGAREVLGLVGPRVNPGHGHTPPQTSRASSTQRASFARSSSTETSFPSTVEENPHCGLTQTWSRAPA